MLPQFRGQTEAVPVRGNWFGSDSHAFGAGMCFVCSLPWCWILHPSQKGSFGSRSSPWSSSCVGWSEGWNPWCGRQRSLCSSTPGIPHTNKSLFMQTPAQQTQCPPPGKSPSCSRAQHIPPESFSTAFIPLFIALFRVPWRRWFYPTSSIF